MSKNTNEKIQPSILPGFMELLPKEQIVFNSFLKKIQESYELFGFLPLDTPIIEKAEVLMAKGGEEAERQTYQFKKGDNDLALRFDLTVPLARYVSEHFNEIHFPFKRYQIGKVYRGEKPQKGRFREFYQCDIDIIGKGSLDIVNDAEILAVIYSTFTKLEIGKFIIRVNNRKLLNGIMSYLGLLDKSSDILRAIDKLEKIGEDQTKQALSDLGISTNAIDTLFAIFAIKGMPDQVVTQLKQTKIDNELFLEGLSELEQFATYIKAFDVSSDYWNIDLTIARGLEYYTGIVYETFLTEYPQLGSICSGGRYDNLAEYYTDEKLPGVGISIGLTRLFYQLNELGMIKNTVGTTAKLLVIPFEGYLENAVKAANQARNLNIPTEVFIDVKAPLKKKLEYANKIGVPFIALVGENEIKSGKLAVKNMATGEQFDLAATELAKIS